ncbi:MAG: hypothetical protein K6B74_01195 [Ruminococcus sp.]|nr:hypothetical protein [Ruminococcus sp.]
MYNLFDFFLGFFDILDILQIGKKIGETVLEKKKVKEIAKSNMPRSGREYDLKDNKIKGNDPERSDK